MFPRRHRLRRERDIRHVLRGGRARRGQFFSIRYSRRTGTTPRFTVVVSTRVSKSAVVRNRLRRQMREAIKKHLNEFPPENDYLVSIFPQSPLPTWSDLHEDLKKFL